MDAVERLLAIEEIRGLIARYAIAFDDHDWPAFAELWADEATFVAAGVAYEGKQALLEFLTTCLPDDYDSKHMNSLPLVELAPDGLRARARTDVVWIAQNFENTIVGRYEDELVKRDGRWLLLRREETPVAFRPGPPPMSEQARAASGPTMRR